MKLVRKNKDKILDRATKKCSRNVAKWSTGAFTCERFKASCPLLPELPNHVGTLRGAGHCFLLPAGLEGLFERSQDSQSLSSIFQSKRARREQAHGVMTYQHQNSGSQGTGQSYLQASAKPLTAGLLFAVPALPAACCSWDALLMPFRSLQQHCH